MTNEEFSRYIEDVQETFGMTLTKKQITFWFRQFIGIDYRVADKMIELFYNCNKKKVRKPRPSDLVDLKAWATKIVISELEAIDEGVNPNKCDCCKNTGLIIVEKYYQGFYRFYEFGYRCFCEHGSNKPDNITQLKQETIRDNYRILAKKPLRLQSKYMYSYEGEKLGLLPDEIRKDSWKPKKKIEKVS